MVQPAQSRLFVFAKAGSCVLLWLVGVANAVASDDVTTLAELRAMLDRGEWREAEARARSTCESWKADRPRRLIDTCTLVLSEALARAGRADEAALLAEEVLGRAREPGGPPIDALELDAWQGLAIARYRQGRFGDAAASAQRAWEGRSSLKGKHHEDTLRSMNTYAISLTNLGETERAIELQEELVIALEETRGAGNEQTLQARGNLAASLARSGRNSEAEERYRALLSIRQATRGDAHPQTLLAATSLANVLLSSGRPAEAATILIPRLPAYRKTFGEGNTDQLAALITEVRIAQDLGHYDEALAKGNATLALSRRALGPDHPRTLVMLYILGVTHYRTRDFAAARAAFEEVRSRRERALGRGAALTLDARNAAAFASLQLGEAGLARDEFREVRELAPANDVGVAARLLARAGLGQALFDLGEREDGIRELELVLAERRSGAPDPTAVLATLATLARFEIIAGRDDRAERHLEELVAAVDEAYRSGFGPGDLRLSQLAAWVDDDFDIAGFKALAEMRVRGGRAAEALRLIEASRARVLREIIALAVQLDKPSEVTRRESIRRTRLQIAELDQRLAHANLTALRREELRASRVELETRMAVEAKLLADPGQPPVAMKLRPDEAYIGYSVNRDRVIAIVQLGNREPAGVDLGLVSGLEATITAWRRMLESPHPEAERVWATRPEGFRWSLAAPAVGSRRVADPDELADYLGRVLVTSLLQKTSGTRRWYVSLDGPLHLLPFDALKVLGKRLVEVREIVAAPSLATLAAISERARPVKGDGGLLAIGALPAGAYAARGLAELPHADAEVSAVASAVGLRSSLVLRGADATEARVRALDKSGELGRFRYIHVASHGILSLTEPQASGIALGETGSDPESDGWLNAGEWATLRIRSDLVTLSACSTGSGRFVRGEGIVGLPSALVSAGARSALLSLWAVSDEGSTRFMASFYRRLRAGAPPARALRETKLEFARSKGPWSSPRHWAPYVLYGAT